MAKKQEERSTVKNPFEDEGKKKLMQAFLKVSGDEPPRIVLQPEEKDSYPADYVQLK